MRLTVVSAGLSTPSSTRLLADRLTEAVRARLPEAEVEVVELRGLALDIAKHLVTGFPPAALGSALDAVAGADGLIAVTPVFNASYSGLFKSFFDLVDRDALNGTPVLLAATGGTARHSLVLDHALRPLFAHLRAQPTATAVYAASEDWGSPGPDASGYGEGLASRVDRAAGELAARMTARPARPGAPGRRALRTAPGPAGRLTAGGYSWV
ncbi:FMN reductase [Streptomyces sp. NPDC016309]|uniref:FMN reductase n=1 Tax=Streptomyces sp. NPDC016309 TaxID=3364965 RepID=UPI0036F8C6E7